MVYNKSSVKGANLKNKRGLPGFHRDQIRGLVMSGVEMSQALGLAWPDPVEYVQA